VPAGCDSTAILHAGEDAAVRIVWTIAEMKINLA
jgi:hypothetical protein